MKMIYRIHTEDCEQFFFSTKEKAEEFILDQNNGPDIDNYYDITEIIIDPINSDYSY